MKIQSRKVLLGIFPLPDFTERVGLPNTDILSKNQFRNLKMSPPDSSL